MKLDSNPWWSAVRSNVSAREPGLDASSDSDLRGRVGPSGRRCRGSEDPPRISTNGLPRHSARPTRAARCRRRRGRIRVERRGRRSGRRAEVRVGSATVRCRRRRQHARAAARSSAPGPVAAPGCIAGLACGCGALRASSAAASRRHRLPGDRTVDHVRTRRPELHVIVCRVDSGASAASAGCVNGAGLLAVTTGGRLVARIMIRS